MHIISVAGIKKRKTNNRLPREGTKIRSIYDMFLANKGKLISMRHDCSIDQLRDIYGMDIICLKRHRYLLAGEWFGKVYIDYMKEAVEKANAVA